MFKFTDDQERLTIRSRSGETREEFLKRIHTWLVVREQQRRRERRNEQQQEVE